MLTPRQKDCARVLEKAWSVYEGDIARPVYIVPGLELGTSMGETSLGIDGKWHVQLRESLARLSFVDLNRDGMMAARLPLTETGRAYSVFVMALGWGEAEDFFDHVLGHEYGHVVFNEILSRSLLKRVGFSVPSGGLHRDLVSHSEAFAHWFSDLVVGIDEPWLFDGMTGSNRHPELERIASLYNGLWDLTRRHGHGAAFDTGLLVRSFAKHDPQASSNGLLYRAA